MALSDDLDRLDTMLRQLQAKWELFFNGAERKPPSELQGQVETLVKRYANVEVRNNGERFRLQTLSSRFATFNELWQKRLRAREEGRAFGMHGLRAEQLPPPAPAAPPPRPPAPAERAAAAEYRVSDGQRDLGAIRALYDSYVAERRRGGDAAAPAFDAFQQLVARQAEKIRAEKGAKAVDFRLETNPDGKVSLKARVVR